MEQYRFSFETDEQYQGRVGQLEVQGGDSKQDAASKESTPQVTPTPVSLSPTPSPSTTTEGTQVAEQPIPQHSTTKLVFPWWLTLAFVVVFIVMFITGRRRNEAHIRLPHTPRKKPHMSVDAITSTRRRDSDISLPVWRVTKVPSAGSQS